MRVMLKIIMVLVVLIISFWFWKNFGFSTKQCENGIFAKYPNGYYDAGTTYYDLNAKQVLGNCSFWNHGSESCQKIEKQAGVCKNTNPINFLLHKWF